MHPCGQTRQMDSHTECATETQAAKGCEVDGSRATRYVTHDGGLDNDGVDVCFQGQARPDWTRACCPESFRQIERQGIGLVGL